ncbi:MAG: hypothetical protein JWM98_1990 [Thermoleophilia bacterium]|nr:hypothetical protein [Thermoleophilia bacterium]
MTSSDAPATAPPADLDLASLSAIFINCTLSRSPKTSHTDRLLRAVSRIMESHGVSTDHLRAIDHRIATGMSPDMTEEGWGEDEWPAIFERVMAADIVVLGTPLWLGEKTSVCTRIVERLYSSSGQFNDKGQYTYVDKVAGWVVNGNEDGVKHVCMNLAFSMAHMGFTVPPNPDAGWIGEIGPGPSFGDDGEVGLDNDFTHKNLSLMSWNLMYSAAMLRKFGGYPAFGTAMEQWGEGERFGTPSLRELVADDR